MVIQFFEWMTRNDNEIAMKKRQAIYYQFIKLVLEFLIAIVYNIHSIRNIYNHYLCI